MIFLYVYLRIQPSLPLPLSQKINKQCNENREPSWWPLAVTLRATLASNNTFRA